MICTNQCGFFNPELVDVFKRVIGDIIKDDAHHLDIPSLVSM